MDRLRDEQVASRYVAVPAEIPPKFWIPVEGLGIRWCSPTRRFHLGASSHPGGIARNPKLHDRVS
jgi:hypothetical protein